MSDNIKEIKIGKEIRFITRDNYYKVINVRDYLRCNGKVEKLFKEHTIKFINIWGGISECGLDEIDKNILHIHFIDKQGKINLEKVYQFKQLLSIEWDYVQNLQIDYSKFPLLEELQTTWSKYIQYKDAKNIKFLSIRSYNNANILQEFPENVELIELYRGKLKSLKGIETAIKLRWLKLEYFPNLEDLESIIKLNNLNFISLNNCGKTIDLEFLSEIKSLQGIYLTGFKEIQSLKPLKNLPILSSVTLDNGTKILDGDKDILKQKNGGISHLFNYTSVTQRLYKEL